MQRSLVQWFSKCGPGTTSICITWELVSNANAQVPLIETLFGGKPSILCVKEHFQVILEV